jgi:hypothetical protein
MMTKQQRDALLKLLPEHVFVEIKGGDHFEARWTTPNGVFKMDTGKWDDSTFMPPPNTRLRVFNETTGEYVMLKTESAARAQVALDLLGAL